ARHLFTGFVICDCGQKMYVPSNSPKYICYSCRNKIGVEDLEAVFQEQLKSFLVSPEEVAAYVGQADEVLKAKEETLQSSVAGEQRVRREMEKVLQLYKADQISVEGFGREYRPLEEQLQQIEEEIPRLQGEVDFLKIEYLSRDEVLSEAKDLHTRWPALEFEEKRQIVENVVERIGIGKDEVAIHLCYLPSPSQMVADSQRNFTGSSPPPVESAQERPPPAAPAR
ncbi:MAG: zinc ribbon domain-containing protein, partial [Candidatus Binatia bacterium]